ncbi:hypothetical protein N7G274_002791 [Stereocaulon virgatum]|uniref:BTB domain-containing protein n=1 Tax=Stereocaulon virgatum TaxID=373712 RepID=A0ABR4AJN0_9LECA
MASSDSEPAGYEGIKNVDTLELLKNATNITVRVGTGDPSDIWLLPKALLTHCSPFFAAALDGNFAESTSNTVLLPDDSPDVFETFVQWMYTGEIHLNIHIDDAYEDWNGFLVDSWILGDKLGCQDLQDAAMKQLLKYHDERAIEPSTVRAAYEGSPSGSKLRVWAIDQLLYDIRAAKHDLFKKVELWTSEVDLIEGFGQDFFRLSLDRGNSKAQDPSENGHRYMEDRSHKDDDKFCDNTVKSPTSTAKNYAANVIIPPPPFSIMAYTAKYFPPLSTVHYANSKKQVFPPSKQPSEPEPAPKNLGSYHKPSSRLLRSHHSSKAALNASTHLAAASFEDP